MIVLNIPVVSFSHMRYFPASALAVSSSSMIFLPSASIFNDFLPYEFCVLFIPTSVSYALSSMPPRVRLSFSVPVMSFSPICVWLSSMVTLHDSSHMRYGRFASSASPSSFQPFFSIKSSPTV